MYLHICFCSSHRNPVSICEQRRGVFLILIASGSFSKSITGGEDATEVEGIGCTSEGVEFHTFTADTGGATPVDNIGLGIGTSLGIVGVEEWFQILTVVGAAVKWGNCCTGCITELLAAVGDDALNATLCDGLSSVINLGRINSCNGFLLPSISTTGRDS